MELHESLYALGRSQGRELFNDADSFRGALDDYLDEQSASTGDINLLVDAVRLGAFQQMTTMIDSGADPDRAVAEAGARLARDRGSADVGGSMWACAALGYAIGKVSDAQVRRFRTQHGSAPSAPQGPPTVLPPSPPMTSPGQPPVTSPGQPPFTSPGQPPVTSPPRPATPGWPSSGPNPTAQAGPAGAPPPPFGQSGGQPSYPSFGGTPPKKRRTGPVVAIVGVAVVILAAAIAVPVFLLGNDDDSPNPPTPTATGPDLDFDAINERYSSLGAMVTSGVSECNEGEVSSGETEKLECTLEDGTLTLTTYASEEEVKAARERILNTDEGTIVSDVESGAYYSYDPKIADETSTEPPILYWDSAAGHQSALYTGSEGVDVDDLHADFEATSPTVQAPTGPVGIQVKDLISRFNVQRCDRIPTEVDGETEESLCTRSTRPTYVGQFATVPDFRSYRQTAFQLSQEDGFPVQDYWYIDDNGNGVQDAAEPEQGKIYGYLEDSEGGSGKAVLYIDDLDCRCYLQMYGKASDDPQTLYNLMF